MNPMRSNYAFDADPNLNYRTRRCSLVPSVSTNSTASNLPGPGRTLGLGYEFVGKHIEIQLGRIAEKLGKGPRKTAIRIERRRSKVIGLPAGSKKIEAKNAKIEKDCRKLLKYVESDVTSTKLQALDQITRLGIEDQFVRDVLCVLNAVHVIEPLQRWRSSGAEFSPILMASSRKALFSLTETALNTIVQEFVAMLHEGTGSFLFDQLYKIQSYVRDPDRAFLVVRHLERLYDKMVFCRPFLSLETSVLDFMRDFDESFSNRFEWNTLDKLIMLYANSVLNQALSFTVLFVGHIGSLMELIIRVPERLFQTVRSDFFSWFAASDNTEYGINLGHFYFTYHLLRGISNANNLDINDCLWFDLAELQGLYPDPAVQLLLYRLTCPPEILLGQIVATRYQFKNAECLDPFSTPKVMESEELEHLCTQLSQYVDSEDELICQRALHAFKYLLSTDIYCRGASLRALSATRFSQTSDFRLLVEESEKKCIPAVDRYSSYDFTRHCTNSGDLLHICVNYRVCCDGIEGTKKTLEFSIQDVLELHIPRGTSFSAAGHLPLLAGVTATGEKVYIVQPVSKRGQCGEYITVSEGTKPEDLRIWESGSHLRRKVVPLYLIVYVLRYAPDAYTRCNRFAQQASDDKVGLDATGPYSWKTVDTDQEMYKSRNASCDSANEDYRSPKISDEEEEVKAAVCEVDEFGVEEQESTEEEWETPNEWESVDITFD